MNIREALTEKIVDIIDEPKPYRILRRPYDKEFAEAHGVTMEDINNSVYIPCLRCGTDIVPKLLLGRRRGRPSVYCSKECRGEHSLFRLAKIDGDTNVNQLVSELIKGAYDISIVQGRPKAAGKGRTSVAVLLLETNNLLKSILKEIQSAKHIES